MIDLTADRLPLLASQRIPGLDLGEGVLFPHYAGNSILNVPASLGQLLGAGPLGAPPLDAAILAPLGETARRVILILMDALSLHRLQHWMMDGTAPVWSRLGEPAVLAPLTSVTPSTTCAALTSLWTGRSPAEHGVVGYELWLKEYGMVANMILHAPMRFNGSAGSLSKAGFQPREYLPFPTLGEHLKAGGVQAHAFQHYTIAHSGLSQMFLKETQVHPFGSAADLWVGVRQLCEAQPYQPMYIWVYWEGVDHLSHHHGPDSEQPAADFSAFSAAFERLFLERLRPALRQDTLVILMADHGQLATPPDSHYLLGSHPGLARRLHITPTGENRLMYLYVRPGQLEAVREYIQRAWLGQFTTVDSAYAAHSGLFGPGEAHPRLLDRLGDLIVFPGESGYIWWAEKENFLLGRHGGLNPQEMLVPFLAARLGG
jgi:hypothetical protein